jgi:hypothetical protein
MKSQYILKAAVVLLATFVVPHSAQARPLGFSEAAARVLKQVEKDHLYSSWARRECLRFEDAGVDAKFQYVEILEGRDRGCKGDSVMGLSIDRFKVDRRTGAIQWEEWGGDYVPYSEVLKVRGPKSKSH